MRTATRTSQHALALLLSIGVCALATGCGAARDRAGSDETAPDVAVPGVTSPNLTSPDVTVPEVVEPAATPAEPSDDLIASIESAVSDAESLVGSLESELGQD